MKDHDRARGCLELILVLALVSMLSCGAAFAAAQVWLPRANLPTGYVVKACMSVRPLPSFRVAAWWTSSLVGRSGRVPPPIVQSNMACGYLPWAPMFPRVGDVETSE